MTEYTKLHNIFKRIGWEEVEGFSELHKIFIIAALAQDTPLMFLDEPTSALDSQNQMHIWEIMCEIAEEGKAILACSHDPNHVAWFCDRVVVMADGTVISNGKPEEGHYRREAGQNLQKYLYCPING